jgi:hypothetical protein
MNTKLKIVDCGICFEPLNIKQIDKCTEIDCKHYYHNKCLKSWCETCVDKEINPHCPLCRCNISGEYLEILGVVINYDDCSMDNAIRLFQYIVTNKLYLEPNTLNEFMENYPQEIHIIKTMLRGYLQLHMIQMINEIL